LEILDSTLREGELYRSFTSDVKVRLASRIAGAGLRRAELTVDYPPRTTEEDVRPVVRMLQDRGVKVVLHGRASEEDLESISKYDVDGCALYIAVSSLHRKFKLHGISEGEAVERLCRALERARSLGFRYIRATLEDASRVFTEQGENGLRRLQPSLRRLRESGATIVSLPDTSGLMTPRAARAFFRVAKQLTGLPLSAHFHNDYGLASANTVEAGLEGAAELQVTLQGIGDRNGIADLYEVVASLEDIHGVKTGVDRQALRSLYSLFSRVTGMELPWRHPLSESAQTVRAGVHQSMTVRRKDGYIPSGKLSNDFGKPLYAVGRYVSHNLVQAILSPYSSLGPESSRRVAEALARTSTDSPPGIHTVRDVILKETGIAVPEHELSRFFGCERLYILLRLKPQYPARRLFEFLSELEGVELVDEVYGDADLVVRARILPGKENPVTAIRRSFADAVQDFKVMVTD